MGLGSFIKKQFIDILQWTEDTDGVLAWRYPMQDFEIQYGASLTVRESQVAVFVNEGKIADVFAPGMYKLTTQTMPVLTYLKNWDKLFESPLSPISIFLVRVSSLDGSGARRNQSPFAIRILAWYECVLSVCILISLLMPKSFTRRSAERATHTREMNWKSNCVSWSWQR